MNYSSPTITSALSGWWREQRARYGWFATFRCLAGIGCEFVRDSMPDRRKQKFGDADYDWQRHVNTTSANVSAKARFIGLLTSSYQPIETELFQEMLNTLGIDYGQFTFIDIGSGKGRALLMASEYPFRRIIGVELLPELHAIAEENIRKARDDLRRCQVIESICSDASAFALPNEPLVIFVFHSLPEAAFRSLMVKIEHSIETCSSPIWFIYANPLFGNMVSELSTLRWKFGTQQYSIFTAGI